MGAPLEITNERVRGTEMVSGPAQSTIVRLARGRIPCKAARMVMMAGNAVHRHGLKK